MDMKVLPKALKAFETLGVKHESLRLITPQFETPLPPLQPAVSRPNSKRFDRVTPIDYRCDDEKKVGELRGDIGAIR
jgi:hypothetical protein